MLSFLCSIIPGLGSANNGLDLKAGIKSQYPRGSVPSDLD